MCARYGLILLLEMSTSLLLTDKFFILILIRRSRVLVLSYGKSMHAEFISSPKVKPAMNQNNYGERLSACAHNTFGPKNKYMATKEVLYVDNQKAAMPIKKKATIIASGFSSPK
jgi:hypothetical protein